MARPSDPQRRTAILEAARAIFLEQGYAGARIADIADRAGVAIGTVYLYFSSKQALAIALADDFFVRLGNALQPSLAHIDRPEGIAVAVETALHCAAAEHDLLRLLRLAVGLSQDAHPAPARRALAVNLAGVLDAQMAAENIQSYDANVLAELLMGLIEWVTEATLTRGVDNYGPYAETLIQLLQRALLPAVKQGSSTGAV